MDEPDKVFIGELEEVLGRNERTIRCWVRDARRACDLSGRDEPPDGYLPRDLWPDQEDAGRQRIFWRPWQVEGLRSFADDKDLRRGWPRLPAA